ncbi:MAG: hypothetical protein NUV65_04990 [Candidatus Roizmanbacteria bacterium]|nr:hypothetical protein [Candidatus Roizmanbacteria bacterium]
MIIIKVLLFIAPLFLLYITSRIVTAMTLEFFAHGFRNRKLAIWLYSLLFLPGIILHEASHVLAALILFVRIGDVSFFPRLEKIDHTEEIRLGYAQIAKSDVFRASLIGAAPLLLGFLLLGFGNSFLFGGSASWESILHTILSWKGIVAIYGGLSISQLMWTSKSDRQDWFIALALLFGIGACLYLLFGIPSVSFIIPSVVYKEISLVSSSVIHGAWFVVGVNVVIVGFLFLLPRQKKRM